MKKKNLGDRLYNFEIETNVQLCSDARVLPAEVGYPSDSTRVARQQTRSTVSGRTPASQLPLPRRTAPGRLCGPGAVKRAPGLSRLRAGRAKDLLLPLRGPAGRVRGLRVTGRLTGCSLACRIAGSYHHRRLRRHVGRRWDALQNGAAACGSPGAPTL